MDNLRGTVLGIVLLCLTSVMQPDARCDEGVSNALVEKLKEEFRQQSVEAKMEHHDKQFRVEFLCQKYQVYPSTKGGVVSKKPFERLGPTDRGFLMILQLSKTRYYGPTGPFTGDHREYYWNIRLHEFKLPKNLGFLQLAFSYGASTDKRILTAIMAVIEKEYGLREEVNDSNPPDTPKCRVDEILEDVEPRLRAMMERLQPGATTRLVEGELVIACRVQEFALYAVSANGSVSSTPHVEVGPVEDGFLVKIRGARPTVKGEEWPIYGKFRTAYWTRYLNSITPDRPGDRQFFPFERLRVEINYGLRSDMQILNGIEEILNEYGKPAHKEGLVR